MLKPGCVNEINVCDEPGKEYRALPPTCKSYAQCEYQSSDLSYFGLILNTTYYRISCSTMVINCAIIRPLSTAMYGAVPRQRLHQQHQVRQYRCTPLWTPRRHKSPPHIQHILHHHRPHYSPRYHLITFVIWKWNK